MLISVSGVGNVTALSNTMLELSTLILASRPVFRAAMAASKVDAVIRSFSAIRS